MNFLKAEIERKRKQLEEKKILGPEKKYFKRADLIEKEREEYFQRHRPKKEDVEKLADNTTSEAKTSKDEGKYLDKEFRGIHGFGNGTKYNILADL